MERVQFQQEQMLDELKDLTEKGLFTKKETKQIMKKRTAFETALVRRVAKKGDFLRYASYEMGLEQLRRKRAERIKSGPAPPTVSDYALVRRIFHIFERALRKFKSDVGLWIQYIQIAKREGARTLVGRITARALQLHPNKPALYILAASHELSHQSPSAARTLLQRGIRLNSESVEMWREYVKMELGFVESLRRRWDVLGINIMPNDSEKGKGKAPDSDDPTHHIMDVHDDLDEAAAWKPTEADAEIDDTALRRDIMQGAIVKSVITSAVQALPRIELFESLNAVLLKYPSPQSLRQAMLEHLYDLLRNTLHDNAGAIKLLADRFLAPELKGEAFVEGIRLANEAMTHGVRENSGEEISRAYAGFVDKWCGAVIDDHLKLYLISSLRLLISQQEHTRTSPSLLSAHVRLLTDLVGIGSAGPAKILCMARRYTTRASKASPVWLARLTAEKRFNTERSDIDKIWAEARRLVEGSEKELREVWMWGLFAEDSPKDRERILEGLLRESMRDSLLHGVHETLLMSYVTAVHEGRVNPDSELTSDQQATVSADWLYTIRHMASAYLTTGRVWQKVFTTLEGEEWGSDPHGKKPLLGEVFEKWRKKDELEATLEWAGWLLRNGKGKEAADVVVRSWVSEGERGELERRWMGILSGEAR